MAVDPSLYLDIEGSTDSETLFFLALTFGLTEDPFGAVARAIGFVEKVGREHGVEYPVPGNRCHEQRRVRLGLPVLQRRQEPVAVLLHHRCDAASSCIPRWRSCTAWVRRRDWSSRNHSVIFPERGTKSPSPRPAWSVPAPMRCAPSSRSLPENAAATSMRRQTGSVSTQHCQGEAHDDVAATRPG